MADFAPQLLPNWRRAVLKVGSSLLADAGGGLSDRHAAQLARFIEHSRGQGRELVLVSSGAVAAGRGRVRQQPGATLPGAKPRSTSTSGAV